MSAGFRSSGLIACAALFAVPAHGQVTKEGEALYRSWKAKLGAARSLSLLLEIRPQNAPPQTWSADFLKPSYLRMDSDTSGAYSDGKAFWTLDKRTGRSRSSPVSGLNGSVPFLAAAFDPQFQNNFKLVSSARIRFEGKESVRLRFELNSPGANRAGASFVRELYLDPKTAFPLASVLSSPRGKTSTVVKRIQLNPPLAASSFTVRLPSGTVPVKSPAAGGLIAVGAKAPEASVAGLDGKTIRLREIWRKNKATIVNFWAIDCPTCLAELPGLQSMWKSMRSKGLGVLAVNVADGSERATRYLAGAGLSLPAAVEQGQVRAASAYRITHIPTNYVIDTTGKVIGALVGYDEAALLAALAKAGVR